jgi:hypothetical protein
LAERLEIEVVITAEGEVKLLTRGLKGKACLEETRALEAALGTVVARTKTSEFYQAAAGSKVGAKGR